MKSRSQEANNAAGEVDYVLEEKLEDSNFVRRRR